MFEDDARHILQAEFSSPFTFTMDGEVTESEGIFHETFMYIDGDGQQIQSDYSRLIFDSTALPSFNKDDDPVFTIKGKQYKMREPKPQKYSSVLSVVAFGRND